MRRKGRKATEGEKGRGIRRKGSRRTAGTLSPHKVAFNPSTLLSTYIILCIKRGEDHILRTWNLYAKEYRSRSKINNINQIIIRPYRIGIN